MSVLVGRRAVTVNNGLVRRITRHTSHSEEAFIRSGSFYLFRSLCACLEPPLIAIFRRLQLVNSFVSSENRPKEGSPDRPAWDAVGCGGMRWDGWDAAGRGATGGVLCNGHATVTVTVGSGLSHTSSVG